MWRRAKKTRFPWYMYGNEGHEKFDQINAVIFIASLIIMALIWLLN